MKNKNFRGSALVAESGEDANLLKMKAEGQSDDEDESSGSDGEYKESSFLDVPLGDGEMDEVPPGGTVDSIKPGAAGEDDLAEFKKTNVGMLRVPFDTKVSWPWVTGFRNFVIGIRHLFFYQIRHHILLCRAPALRCIRKVSWEHECDLPWTILICPSMRWQRGVSCHKEGRAVPRRLGTANYG